MRRLCRIIGGKNHLYKIISFVKQKSFGHTTEAEQICIVMVKRIEILLIEQSLTCSHFIVHKSMQFLPILGTNFGNDFEP